MLHLWQRLCCRTAGTTIPTSLGPRLMGDEFVCVCTGDAGGDKVGDTEGGGEGFEGDSE